MALPFNIPPAERKSSRTCQYLVLPDLFNLGTLVSVQWCLSGVWFVFLWWLMMLRTFSSVYWLFIYLLLSNVWVFCPFFNWAICLCNIEPWEFLCALDRSPLSNMCMINISFQCVSSCSGLSLVPLIYYPASCQHHTVLITAALWCALKSRRSALHLSSPSTKCCEFCNLRSYAPPDTF